MAWGLSVPSSKTGKTSPSSPTILFGLLTIGQVFGLFHLAWGSGGGVLLYATVGMFFLLAATVGYRLSAIADCSAVPALFILYYLYYVGRSISLLLILAKWDFRRREK